MRALIGQAGDDKPIISVFAAIEAILLSDGGFHFGHHRRASPKLFRESLDRPERWGTDVMLHSFHVVINDAVVEAEEPEKIRQELVPMRDLACQRFPTGSQNEATIFFVFKEALGVEPLDHVGDAGLRNFQRGGDIDYASIALGINQFEDSFEVILDRSRVARRIGFARHVIN